MRAFPVVLVALVVVTLVACGTTRTPPAKPDFATIELAQQVWFVAPGGADAIAAPGAYRVEKAGDTSIRLTPAMGKPVTALAVAGPYGAKVSEPTAVHVSQSTGSEHVVLLLPGGKMMDARGTSTGVRARGMEEDLEEIHIMSAHVAEILGGFEAVPELQPISQELAMAIMELGPTVHQALEALNMPEPPERPLVRDLLRDLSQKLRPVRDHRERLHQEIMMLQEHMPDVGEYASQLEQQLMPPYDALMSLVGNVAQRLRASLR